MIIYADPSSGDEVVSDAFKQEAPFGEEELSSVAFQVRSSKVSAGEEDFGISRNVDEDAEEGATGEAGGASSMVIDIVDKFSLMQVPMTKKDFRGIVKDLMKSVVERLEKKNPERVDPFKKEFMVLFKKIEEKFSELDFYFGPNSLDGGVPIISYYEGEEVAPRFVYIKDALDVTKC